MKMRASELASAAILTDGSLSIGFRSSTDNHTVVLARRAQEQLLPALLASEPANLQKFFTPADVPTMVLAEGLMINFTIAERVALRVLLTDPVRQKLLMLLTGSGTAPPAPAAPAA